MIYEACLDYDNAVIIRGNGIVTTPQELYSIVIHPDLSELIIHKEFAEAFFTPSGLSDLKANIERANPHCTVVIDAETTDFGSRAIHALSTYTSADEVIYQFQAHPKEIMGALNRLCENYSNTYTETLVANNKASSLQLQNSELRKKYEDLLEEYAHLIREKSLVDTRLSTLVGRINYSYSKDIDPSQFIQIEEKNRYTKILYIKERTRVRYMDTLLYYLQESLRILYGMPARVVVIGPYYSYSGLRLYRGLQPSYDLSYSQLYSSDIYMPGFQPSVMGDILKNPSNINYLIVLDRGGFDVPHIIGDSVEYVYTMSDTADNYDNIDPRRIISYSHDTLYIPYIKYYESLGLEERMKKYSSMEITQQLIELLEHT